ncbi:ABC transporter permease [Streptomyces sp. NBC_00344]|uniref:ABC transporter permease n=1 Tax=Streptomyces sp. NBC_00344 TaxID=2975720 RepID=UPI002E20309A
MTAPAPVIPAAVSRRSPLRSTGLVWTVLRVHRPALWAWACYVAVTALLLLWLVGPATTAATHEIARCAGHPCTGHPAVWRYKYTLTAVNALIRAAIYAVPAFAGAALIGRELENRTSVLAWTQSVTPVRWLTAKLAVPAVLITAGTGLLAALYRFAMSQRFGIGNWSPYDGSVYNNAGPLAVGYPLLGLAIGALAGMVLGRAVPALVAGTAVTAAAAWVIGHWHYLLWPSRTSTSKVFNGLPEGYNIRAYWLSPSGARLHDAPLHCVRQTCTPDRSGHYVYEYQPLSHYWPLQLLETGIVLALAAVTVAVTFRVLRRRLG